MQFLATLLAAATAVSAGTVTFISQDSINRDIHFTANSNCETMDPVTVPGNKNVSVTFPDSWEGNFYAVQEGDEDKPGMLGEIAWTSWLGITYFDVSAIVDPSDMNNIKEMWPASGAPSSGCGLFPCNNAYYVWDDNLQTKSTTDDVIFCSLGGNGESSTNIARRDVDEEPSPSFSRDFVLGKWSSSKKNKAKRN